MKIFLVAGIIAAISVANMASAQDFDDDSHPQLVTSSKEFMDSGAHVEQFLVDKGFTDDLSSSSFGAMPSNVFEQQTNAIKTAIPIPDIALGQVAVTYDVILQPGHYGRTSGATGTEGRYVNEQQIAAYVVRKAAEHLRAKQLSVLVIEADRYLRDNSATPTYDGLQARVFLAVHADGSAPPCKTGPSLAYAQRSSTYAMHALGWGLAKALGYNYDDFRHDGFTADSAQYYMFRRVRASDLSGLLELGELTCRDSESKLIENSASVAANVAHAIHFVLTVPYTDG